jgi:ADP-dependent NAD(P)H-hydrate dehydratase / NAD(P)H-hydrate epimerase
MAMRKVVAAAEMARVEQLAYKQGASDEAFMQAAGEGIARVVQRHISNSGREWTAHLLCGKGNNAGDAYVAGAELRQRGFLVTASQLFPLSQCSPLCQKKALLFREAGGEIAEISRIDELRLLQQGAIIDGIFGTGFRGEVTGLVAEVIERVNGSGVPIISIDIPSGVNGDTGHRSKSAIQAACTVYLQLPKTGFFIGPGWNCVGDLRGADFGLPETLVAESKADLWMMTEKAAATLLPPLVKNRHKYQRGYVVGLAGSALMPGAALLSSYAALRSGAGIVRILYPAGGPRPAFAPEILAQPVAGAEEALEVMNKATACYVGPGLGLSSESRGLVEGVLRGLKVPCVIDADALNFLAQFSGWALPSQTVLTPHVGEMRRLLGLQKEEQPTGMDWISTCQLYACNRKVVLIVKGSPTFIFDPAVGRAPLVMARGDTGMATAGCGDVLTGLLAALLSQGKAPLEAARLGTYLHAMAGESAARVHTSYGMVASDVTEHLADGFRTLSTISQIALDR